MRTSRRFSRLLMSKGARALTVAAAILMLFQPYAFALSPTATKYVTTFSEGPETPDPNRVEWGTVFNFNNSKAFNAMYAELDESNCTADALDMTFASGPDGFNGLADATWDVGGNVKYSFDGGTTSLKTSITGKGKGDTFAWERKFFYGCGTPSSALLRNTFSYLVTRFDVGTGSPNEFSVKIENPSGTILTLVNTQTLTGTVGSTQPLGTDVNILALNATFFDQTGIYKLRIEGNLKVGNSGVADVKTCGVDLLFEDIDVDIASQQADYRQETEFVINAAPNSELKDYTLKIRAAKKTAGTDNYDVSVYNSVSTNWNVRGTITGTTLTNTAIILSEGEYNGGNVRVRYKDTVTSSDATPGGLNIDFHRIDVNLGACVDQVKGIEADCGKCHNYGGDISKPWPTLGEHNRHAQTESIADCLWCHPNNGLDPAHRDGVVTLEGTKVYRQGGPNPLSAAGYYNSATGACSNVVCHMGQTTPGWTSGVDQNCSRCHNNGAPGPDSPSNLNLDVAWPNTAAHSQHDAAFKINEYSCQQNGSCHPDNRSQHSVVGDGKVEVKMANNFQSRTGGRVQYVKYNAAIVGDGRCYNVLCHGGQETPTWDINRGGGVGINPDTECEKCHTPETLPEGSTDWTNANQANAPVSGLHRGSPSTSGKSHVSEYGCDTCHSGQPSKHFYNSVSLKTNLDTQDMDLPLSASDFRAEIGYTAGSPGATPNYNASNAPTCGTAATVNTYACHAEMQTDANGKDSGVRLVAWKRKWSWDSYYNSTDVRTCNGCHGHWGTFNDGVVEPHVASNTDGTLFTALSNNHEDVGINCGTLCHGQSDPGIYNSVTNSGGYNHGVSLSATAKTIDINTNVNRVYTNGTPDLVGCDNCHNADTFDTIGGNYQTAAAFEASGWLKVNRPDGPAAGGCLGCHDTNSDGILDTYLSTSYASVGSFDTAGGHRHHGGGAARNGAVADAMCSVCHADSQQDMVAPFTTQDVIKLKNVDTQAVIDWNQASPNEANVVEFCTACHDNNGANGNTDPFGDGSDVSQMDINQQYNNTTTGKSHNYSYNTTPQLTKAQSPHGKPGTNDLKQGGAGAAPNDGTSMYVYDTEPVGCNNCHPGHGSSVTNPQPTNTNGEDINTSTIPVRMMVTGYSEPGTCWGCHDSAGVKEYYGDGDNDLNGLADSHWVNNQMSAFDYKKRDYWSRHQILRTSFNPSTNPRGTQDNPNFGTEIACSICHDPHGASNWTGAGGTEYQAFSLRGNWLTSPYLEDRACQKNGASGAAVWVKTDGGAILTGPRNTPLASYNQAPKYGGGYGNSPGNGHDGFYIDENTLGVTGQLATNDIVISRISETDSQFAGLCANCHATSTPGTGNGVNSVSSMKNYLMAKASDTGWAGGKIHYTVRWWGTSAAADVVNPTNLNDRMHLAFGTTDPASTGPYGYQSDTWTRSRGNFQWGANVLSAQAQKYHEFPCSKCHTPHASNLPRLLVTNCLDVGSSLTQHAGGTQPATNPTASATRYAYTYPTFATAADPGNATADWTTKSKPSWWVGASAPLVDPNQAAMHCHNRGKDNKTPSPNGGWNTLTGY